MATEISPPASKRQRTGASRPTLSQDDNFDLRVYSWNVNGIAPFTQKAITSFFSTKTISKVELAAHDNVPKASLRDFLRRHGWPTLLFLQEVKIKPEDFSTMNAVKNAVRRQPREARESPSYVVHFCLPNDKHNACGYGRKLYGVCSIIRQDFFNHYVQRVRPVDWDLEGRFLVIETKRSVSTPKLAIFNIYAVNGTERPYKDSETGDIVGTRHDRKLRIHQLLHDEVRQLEAEGFCAILAGDMNIARSAIDGHPKLRTHPVQHCVNRADFEAKFLELSPNEALEDDREKPLATSKPEGGLDMIDTFRHLHSDKKGYTYYPRGRPFSDSCDRVDKIIISRALEHSLDYAGMLGTPEERGPSDHVPLFASLKFPSFKPIIPGTSTDVEP